MLELDQAGKLSADAEQADFTPLCAVRDLIRERPDEFVQELGGLFLIGTDVQLFSDPHARADLLALDPEGAAVVVAVERDGEHSLLEHGLMCAGLVAGWRPDFFFLYPGSRPAAERRAFLRVSDDQVNRRQRVVLVAHSHDFAVYTAAQWLAQRHGIEIWCVQGRIDELSGRLELVRLGPESFDQQAEEGGTVRIVLAEPSAAPPKPVPGPSPGRPLHPSLDPLTLAVSQACRLQGVWKPGTGTPAGRSIEGRLQQILDEEPPKSAAAAAPESAATDLAAPEAARPEPASTELAVIEPAAGGPTSIGPAAAATTAPLTNGQATPRAIEPPAIEAERDSAAASRALLAPAALPVQLTVEPAVADPLAATKVPTRKTRWIGGTVLLVTVLVVAGIVLLSLRRPAEVPEPQRSAEPEPTPAPGMFSTSVLDAATGKPVAGARLYYAGQSLSAGASGEVKFKIVDGERKLRVKAAGYRRKTVSLDSNQPIRLDPIEVRGYYVSHSYVANTSRRASILNLIRSTSANAVILGVKDVTGHLNVAVENPLATEIGAAGHAETADLASQVAAWKADGIYTVALVALFKDDLLARRKPGLALRSILSRQPIVDPDGIAWADPASPAVQDYNIAVAKAAAAAGFDEINFDFIRYPAEAPSNEGGSPAEYRRRLDTLVRFLHSAKQALAPYNIYLSASVFGAVCSMPNAGVIGQKIEDFAAQLDYVAPMLYPSYFEPGQRIPDPLRQSYQLVFENLGRASRRLEGHSRKLRPWLQNFPDSASPDQPLEAADIRNQIKAAEDARASGWMLWDSRNRYRNTAEALRLLRGDHGRVQASRAELRRDRSLLLPVAGGADGEPPTVSPEGQFGLLGVLLLAGVCLGVLYAAMRAAWLFHSWNRRGPAGRIQPQVAAAPAGGALVGRVSWTALSALAHQEQRFPVSLRRAADSGESN